LFSVSGFLFLGLTGFHLFFSAPGYYFWKTGAAEQQETKNEEL
jgi:hypothetical protein